MRAKTVQSGMSWHCVGAIHFVAECQVVQMQHDLVLETMTRCAGEDPGLAQGFCMGLPSQHIMHALHVCKALPGADVNGMQASS